MSGARHRGKGNRVEREVVAMLRAAGREAQRVPLSGSAGGSYKGDVTVKLLGAVERAMELNQVSAAVAAVREQSILHGLRVERQEMASAGGFETLNDRDYAKKIMERIEMAMRVAVAGPPSDTE